MMKRAICLCCAFLTLLLCFCLPCAAAQELLLAGENMTLQIPGDFTVVTHSNVSALASQLDDYGTTVTETSLKLREGNYLFLAISGSMRCTLFLQKQTDSVSATIGDLISFEDKETAKKLLLGKNLPEGVNVRELEQRGALFYRADCGVQNGIGRLLYITVMNGTCYTLCVVDNSGSISDNTNALIDTVFQTWDYTIDAETQRIKAFRERIGTTVYWVCLPLALAIAGFLIYLLIKDVRRRQMDADRRSNIPKKPRR